MGKTFEELIYGGRMQPSNFGRTTIRRAQPEEEPAKPSNRLQGRAYEQAVNAAYEKSQLASKKMIAEYGTDDPDTAAELSATGAIAKDLPERMRLDPVGTREAVDRAVAIHNTNKATTPDTSQYREGVGKGGERYFTNLTNAELSQQGAPGQLDIQEPVTNLHDIDPTRMGGGGNVGGGGATSPEMTIFEGKLARAQGIAEKPERDMKRLQAKEDYGQTLLDYSLEHGAMAGVNKIKDDLMSGTLGKMGLQPQDAAQVEQMLVKRAVGVAEMAKKRAQGVPPEMAIPWTRHGDKPGAGADLAAPADVLNPGGGPSEMAKEKVRKSQVDADSMDIIDQSMGGEIPRTAHYAKGGKAPKPRPTPAQGGQSPTPFGAPRPTRQVPNPVDEFMRMITPSPVLSPDEALRRKQYDPFALGG